MNFNNMLFLKGRIVNDVKAEDLKKTGSGSAQYSFRIAVQRDYPNAEGNYDADFFSVIAFGADADYVNKNWHKGDEVALHCVLSSGQKQREDGSTDYFTTIIVRDLQRTKKANSVV